MNICHPGKLTSRKINFPGRGKRRLQDWAQGDPIEFVHTIEGPRSGAWGQWASQVGIHPHRDNKKWEIPQKISRVKFIISLPRQWSYLEERSSAKWMSRKSFDPWSLQILKLKILFLVKKNCEKSRPLPFRPLPSRRADFCDFIYLV